MIAVIQTGGKQYCVKEGQTLRVEKLADTEAGSTVTFDQVYLIAAEDGSRVDIGIPSIEKGKVTAKLVTHGRAKKVLVQKFKSKIRYARKYGHRQAYSQIRIEKIFL